MLIKTATAAAEPDLEVGPSRWNERRSDDEQLLCLQQTPSLLYAGQLGGWGGVKDIKDVEGEAEKIRGSSFAYFPYQSST